MASFHRASRRRLRRLTRCPLCRNIAHFINEVPQEVGTNRCPFPELWGLPLNHRFKSACWCRSQGSSQRHNGRVCWLASNQSGQLCNFVPGDTWFHITLVLWCSLPIARPSSPFFWDMSSAQDPNNTPSQIHFYYQYWTGPASSRCWCATTADVSWSLWLKNCCIFEPLMACYCHMKVSWWRCLDIFRCRILCKLPQSLRCRWGREVDTCPWEAASLILRRSKFSPWCKIFASLCMRRLLYREARVPTSSISDVYGEIAASMSGCSFSPQILDF